MSLTLDNRKYSLEELQIKFGQSQGIWLYDICRGIDTSEGNMAPRRHSLYMQYLIKVKKKVTQVKIAKSMMASKVFSPPLRSLVDAERWIAVLGAEIYMRIMDDFDERSRWPKTLMVSINTPVFWLYSLHTTA
jgi:DNA polymerase eta